MHHNKWPIFAINIIGGIAVLASYVIGFRDHANASQVLWGGVPDGMRSLYTVNMFLAAVGYFAFSYFILFRLDPKETRIAGRFGFRLFTFLYALILLPSALWLPLTFQALGHSSPLLLWFVRIDLVLVAVGSLGLPYALIKVTPKMPVWAYRLALVGTFFFCLQTVILDAIIWGSFFQN